MTNEVHKIWAIAVVIIVACLCVTTCQLSSDKAKVAMQQQQEPTNGQ